MKKQEFDYEAWKSRFDKLLPQDRLASESWKQLRGTGLDLDQVAYLLFLACDFEGSPGYMSSSMEGDTLERKSKEAQRLAKRLREDRQAVIDLGEGGSQDVLISALDTYATELEISATEVLGFISKRTFSPTIFRAWLITVVKEQAKRPNYRELSFLLDIAYEAHGQERPALGADVLRKAYRRYSDSPPDFGFLRPQTIFPILIGFALSALAYSLKQAKPEE